MNINDIKRVWLENNVDFINGIGFKLKVFKHTHRILCFCVSRFILTLLFSKKEFSFFEKKKNKLTIKPL